MGKEAAVLLIRVRADSREAQRDLKNVYAIAGREAKEGASRVVRAESEKTQAVRQAAREVQKAEREKTAAAKQAAKEQERAAKEAARAAEKSARDQKSSLLAALKDVERQRNAESRSLVAATRAAEREYDRRAKAAERSLKRETDAARRASREQERLQQQQRRQSFGAGFGRVLATSRFTLPGTNGGLMPLLGQTVGGGLGSMAALATVGAGAAVLDGIKRGVDDAAELQRTLNVLAVQSGATKGQLDQLRETARALGADTELPATSSLDAAKAMFELSKAGLSVRETMDAARGTLQLAAAAEISAAEAGKIVATQLKAFGLEGKEATRVADLLAATANNSAADIQGLADGAQQAAAVFKMANFSVEDLYTGLGLMADAGIQGSDAGTSLKTAVLALISPTKEAAKMMQAVGLSVYDANHKLLPFREIVARTSQSLQGLTEEQRNAALKTIFGTDAIRAANIVFGAHVEKVDAARAKYTQAGAAAELNRAKMQGLKGAQEAFNSTVQTFNEKIGSRFLNFLSEVISLATESVGALDNMADGVDGVGLAATTAFRNVADLMDIIQNSVRTARQEMSAFGKAATANDDAGFLRDFRQKLGSVGGRLSLTDEEMTRGTQLLQKYGVPVGTGLNARSVYDPQDYQRAENAARAQADRFIQEESQKRRDAASPYRQVDGMGADYGYGRGSGTTKAVPIDTDKGKRVDAARAGRGSGKSKADRDAERAEKQAETERKRQAEVIARLQDEARRYTSEGQDDAKARAFKSATDGLTTTTPDFMSVGDNLNEWKSALIKMMMESNAELLKISEEWYKQELAGIESERGRDSARQEGDTPAMLAERQRAANAKAETAKAKAKDRRDARTAQVEKAVQDRLDAINQGLKEEEDRRGDEAEKRVKAVEAYIASNNELTDAQIAAAEETNDFGRQVALQQRKFANAMDLWAYQLPAALGKAVMGDATDLNNLNAARVKAESEYAKAVKAINEKWLKSLERDLTQSAAAKNAQGPEDARTQKWTDPETGIEYEWNEDPAGMSEEDQQARRDYQIRKEREARNRAVAATKAGRVTDFVARPLERGVENAVTGRTDLKQILPDILQSLRDQAGQEIGGEVGRVLTRELRPVFTDLIQDWGEKLTKFDLSTGSILQAAAQIYGASSLLVGSKGGKPDALDYAIGVASFFPGAAPFAAGAKLARQVFGFADGGEPPVGRMSWVGEREPELFVPREPGVILNQKQLSAVRGGSGGTTNVYIDTVNNKADADHLIRRLDQRRQREALVK